jgi:hypothetical protein
VAKEPAAENHFTRFYGLVAQAVNARAFGLPPSVKRGPNAEIFSIFRGRRGIPRKTFARSLGASAADDHGPSKKDCLGEKRGSANRVPGQTVSWQTERLIGK